MAEYVRRFGAGLIGVLYVAVSLAWISGSDSLVALLASSASDVTFWQTFKGTGFVVATGLALYGLIRLYEKQITRSQRDAEERVRTVLTDAPTAVLLIDPETFEIIESNAAANSAVGHGQRKLVGLTLDELFSPRATPAHPSGPDWRAHIDTAVRNGAAAAEWTIKGRAGEDIVYDVRLTSVVYAGRTLLQVTLAEVTQARVVETVLRDLGASLAHSVGTRFHVSLAQSLARTLGVQHVFIAQIDDHDSLRTTALIVDGVLAENVVFRSAGTACDGVLKQAAPALVNDIQVFREDAQRLGLAGSRAYAGVPLSDSQGRLLGVLAVMHSKPFPRESLVVDVLTLAAGRASAELERIRAEAAMQESEQRFRQFANASSDWLWEQDDELRFTYLSDGWSKATSRSLATALGRTRWELAGVDAATEAAWAEHKRLLKARQPFRDLEYSIRLPDGRVRHWIAHGTPVFDADGRFTGYRGSTSDQTDKVEALQRAEQAQERLKDAIHSLPAGFVMFDKNDRLVLANDRYIEQAGGTAVLQECQNTFEDIVRQMLEQNPLHPSMGDSEAFYRKRLEDHRNLPSHQEIQFADGTWTEVREFPTREGGSALLWHTITDRKRMEAELRDSEERFRSLIDEASQGIIVHYQMKPYYCNPAFAQMFGYDGIDEILSLESIIDLFAEIDRDRLRNYSIQRIRNPDIPMKYEFTGLKKSGEHIAVQNRVVQVPWNGRHAICANMFDVTEQKAVERALGRSEKEFRDLIEGSVQGVIIHADGALRFANKAAARMFGYESPDALLREASISDLFAADVLQSDTPDDTDRSAPVAVETECKRLDGSTLWLELLVRDVNWQGEAATQVTMIDASFRKEAEGALLRSQRMESIGQLSGGIAHDFNNLLGIVMGNLQFIERMVRDNEKAAGRVTTALKAVKRGSQLTQRLLGFSSQESMPGTPTNANDVVRGLEDILTRSLTRKIEVEIHPDPELWLTEIDPGELEDALLNLTLNARDAMPDGGRLVIETVNRSVDNGQAKAPTAGIDLDPGDYVVVSVNDNGTGMEQAVLERAFEPFFTTKPTDRGTGMGLSMVYGFAKRSRGDVRIYSEPGHGTTVRLLLPRCAATDGPSIIPIGVPDPLPSGTETILLVDDEPDLLEVADTMLRDLGYRTITARNGREALSIIDDCEKRAEIDLVFTDVIMPGGINGFELADRIIETDPSIKVLLASGFTGRLTDRSHDSSMIRSMLHKPYDKTTLAHSVRRAFAAATS
ncbi:PAS domain S-box protein [Thalassobaculum sp.]|uniref:PAS domain S-box protein n=1 Tax=Thalassobaculum sp. TaxID=2022740 RepID=UPI0032EB7618